MPIYRSNNSRKSFLWMSNHSTRNKELSLKAKGLIAVLMDLPPAWHFSVAGLSKIMPDGPDSIRSAMHELESAGYLERIRNTGSNGRSYVEYNIYEMPKETMFGESNVLSWDCDGYLAVQAKYAFVCSHRFGNTSSGGI